MSTSNTSFALERDAASTDLVPVSKWCRPVRVHVEARAQEPHPGHLSSRGRGIHCVWRSLGGTSQRSIRRVRAASPLEIWTDCGSVLLRAGGELLLTGGAHGWIINVWVQDESQIDPAWYWLTTFRTQEATVGEWPPGATHFRLLNGSGRLTAEATILEAGRVYPIPQLGNATGVLVRGHYQVGTIVP